MQNNVAALNKLLRQKISEANGVAKPYVNLVNDDPYSIADISNDLNIALYKERHLSCIYYKTSDLILDQAFADCLHKLTDAGIREILIFCFRRKTPQSEAFNSFLKTHGIRINFKVAVLSPEQLHLIQDDLVGKRDLLGFDRIEDHQLVYDGPQMLYQDSSNPIKVPLLNNDQSDQIILQNHVKYRQELFERFGVRAKEPEYITDSKLSPKQSKQAGRQIPQGDEVRTCKVLEELRRDSLELGTEQVMELTQQQEVEQTTIMQITQEEAEEINFDQKQRKLTQEEANTFFIRLNHEQFAEEYLFGKKKYYRTWKIKDRIELLFLDERIKFISQEALVLIFPYINLFSSGLNLKNLPKGLAFDSHQGIIFVSDQRPKNMPVNEGTISLSSPLAAVSNPLQYSWLPFASRRSISFDDIYGTKEAPKTPLGKHAIFDELWQLPDACKNFQLDMPVNFVQFSHYSVDRWGASFELTFPPNIGILQQQQVVIYDSSLQQHNFYSGFGCQVIFPRIQFYNLTEMEKLRLQDIWQELKQRKIEILFTNILKSNKIEDAGYILDERTSAFLKRLFAEILPLSKPNKHKFFEGFVYSFGDYYSRSYVLEDVFEGLSYAYDQFEMFLAEEGIVEQDRKEHLYEKFAEALKKILKTGVKSDSNHLIEVLRNAISSGGNLDEQLEYFCNPSANRDRLNAQSLKQARSLSIGVLHSYQMDGYRAYDKVDVFGIKKPIEQLDTVLSYLSSVPTYQRPSVDSYSCFMVKASGGVYIDKDLYIISHIKGVYIQASEEEHALLSTVEYVEGFLLKEGTKVPGDQKSSEKLDKLIKDEICNVKSKAFLQVGIIAEGTNLVNGFTAKQANLNISLLALNIQSSIGRYYNQQYPHQEFGSYVALFGIIFNKVKPQKEIKIGSTKLVVADNRYDAKYYISEQIDRSANNPYGPEILAKEEEHQRIINLFCELHKENQEFNFSEIVGLGLVKYFYPQEAVTCLNSAKKLSSNYHYYFGQMLRAMLAIPSGIASASDEIELKNRVENIVRSLKFLDQSVKIQQMLTANGQHPENLVFFAACLGNKKNLTESDIENLLIAINKLGDKKRIILAQLADSKLPFANGVLNSSILFPQFTINAQVEIIPLSNNAKCEPINNSFAIRFNDASSKKRQKTIVCLKEIERQFNVTFVQIGLSFARWNYSILTYPNFIKENVRSAKKGCTLIDGDLRKIEQALAVAMFEALIERKGNWQQISRSCVALLYNPTRPLREQLEAINHYWGALNALLNVCGEDEKLPLLQLLSSPPAVVLDKKVDDFLSYMKSIASQLKANNLSSLKILGLSNKQFYIDKGRFFKLATDFFLANRSVINIDIKSYYDFFVKFSDVDIDNGRFFEKILSSCLKWKDFSLLKVLLDIDPNRVVDCKQKIEWLLNLDSSIIEMFIKIRVDLALLFSIQDLEKIAIVADIIVKLGNNLSAHGYTRIINHIKVCSLEEAYLLKSYLLFPNLECDQGIDQQQIKLILMNLHSLPKLQSEIFKKTERFTLTEEKRAEFESKLKELVSIPFDSEKPVVWNGISMETVTRVMKYGSEYSLYSYDQIRCEVASLKHKRCLAENNNEELDLRYLALTIEAIYRCTGKFPYDTQILSGLMAVVNDKHAILEVATGEGKGITSALIASYLWFTGQTVDVVTSSEYLSRRDLVEFSPFFDSLGIRHNVKPIFPSSDPKVYVKGGINYAIASNLALFRCNNEFYQERFDPALNANVSLICDEGDAALTGEINFKLTIPWVNLTNNETEVLFDYILKFIETPIFKNSKVNRKDDVHNLFLYFGYQFSVQNLSCPLKREDAERLKNEVNNPTSQRLYALDQALKKFKKHEYCNLLFSVLLDSANIAKKLKLGVDFVLPSLQKQATGELIKAIPIVKDQPCEVTVYGNGIQEFVHMLLKRTHPHLNLRHFLPTTTIFNLTPKNFFDYYRMVNGRIIALTGTAGNLIELKEFYKLYGIEPYKIPLFKASQRTPDSFCIMEAVNEIEQIGILKRKLIDNKNNDRPMLIFCDSPQQATEVFKGIKRESLQGRKKLQMFALSEQDTLKDQEELLNTAGNNNTITIVTKMQGRGTDFDTKNPEGFLGINLCTEITRSGLRQIEGRVGRKGTKGHMFSIFRKNCYGIREGNYTEHMENIAKKEKEQRKILRPVGDIMKFFTRLNQGKPDQAIEMNRFIEATWKDLISINAKSPSPKKLKILRNELIVKIGERYPIEAKNLQKYLDGLNSEKTKHPIKVIYGCEASASNVNSSANTDFLELKDLFSKHDRSNLPVHPAFKAIRAIITSYCPVKSLKIDKLELGKYQAIGLPNNIVVTNGKYLFLVSRRSCQKENSEIKVFKITQGIAQVKAVFKSLSTKVTEASVNEAMRTLVETDKEGKAKFIAIKMAETKTNHSFGSIEGKALVKIAAIAGYINDLGDEPFALESSAWQQAIKKANDIYKDFTTFARIVRANERLSKIESEKNTLELLISRTIEPWLKAKKRYGGTYYEKQYNLITYELQQFVVMTILSSLEEKYDREEIKEIINHYRLVGIFYKFIKDAFAKKGEAKGKELKLIISSLVTQWENFKSIKEYKEQVISLRAQFCNTLNFDDPTEVAKFQEALTKANAILCALKLDIDRIGSSPTEYTKAVLVEEANELAEINFEEQQWLLETIGLIGKTLELTHDVLVTSFSSVTSHIGAQQGQLNAQLCRLAENDSLSIQYPQLLVPNEAALKAIMEKLAAAISKTEERLQVPVDAYSSIILTKVISKLDEINFIGSLVQKTYLTLLSAQESLLNRIPAFEENFFQVLSKGGEVDEKKLANLFRILEEKQKELRKIKLLINSIPEKLDYKAIKNHLTQELEIVTKEIMGAQNALNLLSMQIPEVNFIARTLAEVNGEMTKIKQAFDGKAILGNIQLVRNLAGTLRLLDAKLRVVDQVIKQYKLDDSLPDVVKAILQKKLAVANKIKCDHKFLLLLHQNLDYIQKSVEEVREFSKAYDEQYLVMRFAANRVNTDDRFILYKERILAKSTELTKQIAALPSTFGYDPLGNTVSSQEDALRAIKQAIDILIEEHKEIKQIDRIEGDAVKLSNKLKNITEEVQFVNAKLQLLQLKGKLKLLRKKDKLLSEHRDAYLKLVLGGGEAKKIRQDKQVKMVAMDAYLDLLISQCDYRVSVDKILQQTAFLKDELNRDWFQRAENIESVKAQLNVNLKSLQGYKASLEEACALLANDIPCRNEFMLMCNEVLKTIANAQEDAKLVSNECDKLLIVEAESQKFEHLKQQFAANPSSKQAKIISDQLPKIIQDLNNSLPIITSIDENSGVKEAKTIATSKINRLILEVTAYKHQLDRAIEIKKDLSKKVGKIKDYNETWEYLWLQILAFFQFILKFFTKYDYALENNKHMQTLEGLESSIGAIERPLSNSLKSNDVLFFQDVELAEARLAELRPTALENCVV